MGAQRHSARVQASILDRLLDDAPDELRESATGQYDIRALKQSVARDLEALLNTRKGDVDARLAEFPLARRSVIGFGVSDLTSISLLNPDDRARLREELRSAIIHYEPRLTRVRVELEAPRETERMLRFRVDAVLSTHPSRPPVTFDATLQLSSKVYRVMGQA